MKLRAEFRFNVPATKSLLDRKVTQASLVPCERGFELVVGEGRPVNRKNERLLRLRLPADLAASLGVTAGQKFLLIEQMVPKPVERPLKRRYHLERRVPFRKALILKPVDDIEPGLRGVTVSVGV